MTPGFGDDFKELVRSSTSLADLVSETVALKPLRGGSDYVGLCPFHDDRNPSLHVYPDRQSYRCWVCDAGGDCFRWVMEIEKVSFPEAIESLARRANLEIPRRARPAGDNQSELRKSDTYTVLEWASGLLQQALRIGGAGALARQYVQQRKLTDNTLREFRIGYHPEDWNWFLEQARGRFTPQQLLTAGLIGERATGQGYYDNLVGRLVFPILDERGRVVAFGGRVLPGSNITSDAKYWNSRESGIFHKSRMLYAFDRAREAIRRSRTAIVVEGYMDCIACHQAGVQNVVATLGTALTEEHVRFLRRFAQCVVLTFDSDDPGQKAAERSISRFLSQDMDLRILTLPAGKDPADFLEVHTADEFRVLAQQAPEAWEYKLQTVTRRLGTDSISGRQQILNEMLEFLAAAPGMPGSVREDLILRAVCQRIQLDERTARKQLKELREKQQVQRAVRRDAELSRPSAEHLEPAGEPALSDSPEDGPLPADLFAVDRPAVSQAPALELAERELLEIILTCPEYIDFIRHHIGADDFENPRHQRLLALCIDVRKEDGDLPELSRLVIAAESDSQLLSLMNAVVDAAEQKGIFRLMNEQVLNPGQDAASPIPLHLQRVLGPLLERREKQRNLVSKQRMAQTDVSSSELNDDQKQALRQLYRFRLNQMGQQIHLK